MTTINLGYVPLSMYAPAHASQAPDRLLVGGFGTGKSMALCADAISFGLQVPGARILMTRRTVPELRDTLEPVFLDVLPHDLFMDSKVTRKGGHIHEIILPNGTTFLFLSIDDWQKHKSLNLARIYWDELSEFDEGTYNGMRARCRQVELTAAARAAGYDHKIPSHVLGSMASTNPNGRSWIYRRWVEKPKAGHQLWTGSSLDNPHLPEPYLKTLLSMPAAWVNRYVFASWDEFGGAVYPEWSRATHVWKGRDFPHTDAIWMALDPGTRHPTAGLWVVHHGRNLIAVAEHLEQGKTVQQHAAQFRRIEQRLGLPVRWRVADRNSVHVRDRGSQMSLHTQYKKQGFTFQNGVSSYQDRLPMLGQLVKEKRIFATAMTPLFFEQMQDYKWEDLTPAMKRKIGSENEDYGPERPVKVKDDLVDCAQMLSARVAASPQDLRRARREYPNAWAEFSQEEIRPALQKSRAANRAPKGSPSEIGVAV